ncbi:MAG: hypothetical protein GQ570_13540 [Helicobacteraceae bacterium]|nr:hypothetical protein [Helicobacteraceae bacterium]
MNPLIKYPFFILVGYALLFTFFTQELLTGYANMFRVNSATKGADAIIILGGNDKTRPSYASKLIKENYAKEIILTSPKQYRTQLNGILKSEQERYLEVLKSNGVTATIIPSTKGGATSTFDEAIDLVEFLKTHPMKHVIIVTDSFHTARSKYAFNKIMELNNIKDLKIEMAAAPNEIFNESNWYKTEAGLSSYIMEPLKFIFYFFNSSNATIVEER